jgi:hypothetical protein
MAKIALTTSKGRERYRSQYMYTVSGPFSACELPLMAGLDNLSFAIQAFDSELLYISSTSYILAIGKAEEASRNGIIVYCTNAIFIQDNIRRV